MEQLIEELEARRGHLFALSYRMLGSVAEAEDVLQEAAVRARTAEGPVESPRAWTTAVVTRLCLDQLKSARRKREEYVGPWLPEPVLADAPPPAPPDERIGIAESVSMAFLVLLERLSPLERAVFLLREVFDYDFAEIARYLDRSEAACRQLFHRARTHVEAGRPRFQTASATRDRLARAFLEALQSGDTNSLGQLLADDVRVWSDSGGKARAARKPIEGRDAAGRLLVGIARKAPPGTTIERAEINGQPGYLLHWDGAIRGAVALDIEGEHIVGVRIVVNPDKLQRLGSDRPGPADKIR